jgi:hypothetical protein
MMDIDDAFSGRFRRDLDDESFLRRVRLTLKRFARRRHLCGSRPRLRCLDGTDEAANFRSGDAVFNESEARNLRNFCVRRPTRDICVFSMLVARREHGVCLSGGYKSLASRSTLSRLR